MESFQIRQATVNVCNDKSELTRQVANAIVQIAHKAIEMNGRCVISLSGGSTPKALYALLAQREFVKQIEWDKIHLFWGDERCVSREHKDSNFGMVFEVLIRHVPLPPANIHAPQGQDVNPEESAKEYQQELCKYFALGENEVPMFDLVLLGLGPDGHTASIFPGTSAVEESKKFVVAVYVEKFASYRLTLTLPVINNAKNVFFLVEGKEKASILSQVLLTAPCRLPAHMVAPKGALRWFIDLEAAQMLEKGIIFADGTKI